MRIEVLAVGDELLLGATQDSNSGFAAREMFASGLQLAQVTVVSDADAELRAGVEAALARCQALVVTGGLGPTVDDRTKEVVAALLGDELLLDEAILDDIRARFARRGRPMPEINVKQAMMPRGARVIPNPVGSAPGVHWTRDGREVFLLPGVPAEMRAMFSATVLPRLVTVGHPQPACFAAFRTVGVPESELAERVAGITGAFPAAVWAFYPGWGGVDVKVRRGGAADSSWTLLCDQLRAALGQTCYSERADESLAEVVQKLLIERSMTVAFAESCTGGLLSARFTDVAGASACFTGGFVTYANAAKMEWLGVPEDLLRAHGAVSAPVAAAMARGARDHAASDIAVSVTGVAGPSGGTPEKPVGLVFVALAAAGGCWVRRLHLFQNRELNRYVASQMALDLVRRHLHGWPVGDPA